MPSKTSPPAKEPIAIIGSACHFAGGVNSPSRLWDLLRDPRDVRREIPNSRFSAEGFYHPNPAQHGHSNVIHSYLIEDDVTAFDAEFFGVKPVEAQAMDPQQRMLMETVYEAIESAGLTLDGLRRSDTSVFVGVMCADYEALQLRDMESIPTYLATGTARSILSNRISYFFDWHGPSMTIDTACSSSLVAVHQAVQTLRCGESRMAVACGSNLILGPENYIMESKLNMLSPDGYGKMWDKSANGYARGEGVATLVLKPLSSAIADGDHIECLIRETGVNQDGATAGITMPSVTAQQTLIEDTYSKAGLDAKAKADRPQLFEAHGTGTPAGDPVEAEAISRAFFYQDKGAVHHSASDRMSVGSIKTILGHTEGTAGIAAVLRTSLAIQHRKVPPNLHFTDLNPAIAPFYNCLDIPKAIKPWPDVSDGPRRASVNSFGFGGTNAHAILESYDLVSTPDSTDNPLFTPYVFSARSERSLRTYLLEFSQVANLQDTHSSINTHDLAYTLRQRRSVFPHRVTYTAGSPEALRDQILSSLADEDSSIGVNTRAQGPPVTGGAHKILGIFTGQGAQYPRMGAALIEKSQLADRIIRDLEDHLSRLPETDRPSWSLRSELLASSTSRVREAAISQPLCTAVQILLVDLLRIANIRFDVVVGHSSGEMAAAYAAGCLTARDAIAIAYYRGLHCGRAASPNGSDIRGAMLAVGTSMEDATELCEDDLFAGRINLAACNSSSSVTISGDEDAITELEAVLADENKFYRRLRVDQAYHSAHMQPCFDAYVQSLCRAGVQAQSPSAGCRWYTSVHDGRLMHEGTKLSNAYWAENMVKPVLFNQALSAALSDHGPFSVVLEVGPHPALKGPATQTIYEVLERSIPYHGCLDRNSGAVEAMSNCMGFLWSNLGASFSVDLNAYEIALSGKGETNRFSVVKGLPSYQWDHDVKPWHESRRSRRMRLRGPSHPLLGDESPDSSPHHRCWRNIVKPSEMDWLEGHRVQGQLVFPAAGYITTALEAAKLLASGRDIRLIEISDFLIHRAITFDSETSAVEVLTEMSHIIEDGSNSIRAKFTYSAALESHASDLSLASNGEIRIILGVASSSVLPRRRPQPPHLLELESQRLYGFMEGLGYNFSGLFRSLKNLQRKHGRALCQLPMQDSEPSLLLHPAEVDAAFQSIMLAYSYPGDDQLRNLHLPASISRLRVNPTLCASCRVDREDFSVDSVCSRADRASPGLGFSGHFSLYTSGCSNAALQADGVRFIPFAGAINGDRNVFYKMDWVPTIPNGTAAAAGISVCKGETDVISVLSRIASYYLRKFDAEVAPESPARTERSLCHYLNYARHMTDLLRKGEHKYAKKEWLEDTLNDVMDDVKQLGFSDRADVKLALLVGETMPRVFKQETSMIEHMRTSGLLDEYYSRGFGMKQSSVWLSQAIKQITDRHPHLSVLEIGAGTGGATKDILSIIGGSFDSYTFTDISSSFFGNAAESLMPWRDRIVFKVLDAERSPAEQGFDEGTYDVVVASFVIHATARLRDTMRNLRKLLKPGGYLVVGEGTSDGPLQCGDGFIFGPLPGWWLGVDEGRVFTPFINLGQWDTLLKETGFSGFESIMPSELSDTFGLALFVSQAVDDRISFLREPLAAVRYPGVAGTNVSKLIIVGGITAPVGKLAHELEVLFSGLSREIISCKSLEDVDYASLDESSSVICLAELDTPSFKDMTSERWKSFKKMFEAGKTLLWVSRGRLADQPWSNMPVGFGRTALNETADLHVQFLDFPSIEEANPRTIAESLLRLRVKDLSSDDLLWTVEPEVTIDQNGSHLVPRLRSIDAANDRYNSIQHPISRELDLKRSVVELQHTADSCCIRELSRYEVAEHGDSRTIKLQTTSTVLSALNTSVGHQFLALGVNPEGHRYLCLTPRLSNFLEVSETCAVPYKLEGHECDESGFLTAVAAHLVALFLLDPVFPSQKIALHNPSPVIAQAIDHQALRKGVSALYYTTENDNNQQSSLDSWTILSPYASRSELLDIFPASQFVSFAGLSGEGDILQHENEATMMSTLSHHCRRETAATIYSRDGNDASSSASLQLGDILKRAAEFAYQTALSKPQCIAETTSLVTLTTRERPKNPLTIIDWTTPATISAQVSRLDTKPIFKNDKTYWVCGMSGALGISVCDWMIDRGARHLVVTSRNPKIEVVWVENHRSNGVTVNIMSCDVTNEEALRAVHRSIVQTMPPIAGALNGAMVLRDTSIPNMGYDDVMDVVKPKVLGSLYLDRIFYNTNLDFFILISSITCVVGNVGQANYAAANMYMCSLAANRRKRGLNAIALNGGAIIGAGYITRETDRALDLTVEKMALMRLSEEDFHQMIAEAIESGHVGCSDGVEITTGLLDIAPDSPNIPKWYRNPKFSRFIVQQSASDEGRREQTATASIQDQLQACKTRRDLILLVEQSFSSQLRKLLLTSTDVSDKEILSKRSAELGLDSLISVDLRSWFSKNFKVNIPVLKIMGNDTMMTLLQTVVESIPAEMVPNIPAVAEVDDLKDNSSSTTSVELESMTGSGVLTPATPRSPVAIDWEAESAPPADLANMSVTTGSPPVTPPKVIVVTGVTGHLGHHLLEHLLNDTTAEIHCLAVRGLAARLQNKELLLNSRIRYHAGSLSDHLLGLSDEDAKSLFARADAVIHNGADTSHMKFYRDLRAANVDSTVALTRLCLPRRIPMHYISSAGVCIYYNRDLFPAVSVTGSGSLLPAPDGSFGYACSKWVNERFLERVNEQYDLPVCIYRPSTIIRRGVDATTSQAELDWVNALLQYTRKIEAAPKVEHNRGALDLVWTETCCAGVLSRVSTGAPKTGLEYVNQVGDIVVPMEGIRDIDADEGKRYGVLPLGEWIDKAIDAGLHVGVAHLIQKMDAADMPDYPRLSKEPE